MLLLMLPASAARAQRVVRGVVADSASREALVGANAVLMYADSSFVRGVATDTTGHFRLSVPSRGTYILRFSMMGYKQLFVNLPKLKRGETDKIDTVSLAINEVALAGATVTGTHADMQTDGDTVSFNAEEYHVPEGEALEELIKLLPGVEVDGNSITYNGKAISEFKVNGKDFFKGKRGVAMKNLPVELVKRVKTYEKKSDYAEQTGIDDGNEQTIMDIELKKELNETWITNYDAGVGSKGRYLQKAFANRMTERSRISLVGNASDDDARSNNKTAGADFSVNNGRDRKQNGRFEAGGHLEAHNNHSHSQTWRSAENYIGSQQTSQFSNSNNYNKSRNTGLGGNFRIEWHPDTLTTVTSNASFNTGDSRSYSRARSARLNADPYSLVSGDSPLDSIFADDFSAATFPALYAAAINRNGNESKGNNDSRSVNFSAMAVRRLNGKGRNVSLDVNASGSRGKGKSFRISDIYYYKRAASKQHTRQNQYTYSPSDNANFSTRISYSEPLLKGLHLQASYHFQRSRNHGERSLFRLDSLENDDYRLELGELPAVRDTLQTVIDLNNSNFSTYNNYNHTLNVGLNYNSRKLNAYASTGMASRFTRLDYRRASIDTTFSRHLLRFSPSAMLRYRFSRNERFELRYSGWNDDPAMTNRIPVTDNSDPLNIRLSGGNLKPAWNNQLRMEYSKYIVKRQQNWQVNARFNQSSNNISTAIIYDESTGVRTTMPKNINGNWSASSDFTFSMGFGAKKAFRLNTTTSGSYDNSVGYISGSGAGGSSEKNTTRTTGIRQRVNLRYHSSIVEASIGGRLNYRHTDNKLRPQSNLDTYNYSYSARGRVRLPWRMTIETSLSMNSRRGYSSASMNTDELIWDASASQNFFRGSPLIVRLQLFDILHRRSNISRSISAQSRVDSENDASYSYFMFHLILRLNIFNGKVSSGFSHRRGPQGGRGGGFGGPGRGPR